MSRKRKTWTIEPRHEEANEVMNWLLVNCPHLAHLLQLRQSGVVYILDPYCLFLWGLENIDKLQAKLRPRSLKYQVAR